MITNSLEWSTRRAVLQQQISGMPYNKDLRVLLKNIDGMVVELSKLEVVARRTKNNSAINGQLDNINGAIETLEKWIMMAALLS